MNAHAHNFEALATEQVNSITASSQAIGEKIAGLVDSNVSYSKRSFEYAAEFMQSLAEKRDMSDIVSAQTKFISTQSGAFMEHCESVSDALRNITAEAMRPAQVAKSNVEAQVAA